MGKKILIYNFTLKHCLSKTVSEYGQEIPQSQTADKSMNL